MGEDDGRGHARRRAQIKWRPVPAIVALTGCRLLPHLSRMITLEKKLEELKPQEKRALADWLWRSAERAPALGRAQIDLLNSRAEAALKDRSKRYPGDAEKSCVDDEWVQVEGYSEDYQAAYDYFKQRGGVPAAARFVERYKPCVKTIVAQPRSSAVVDTDGGKSRSRIPRSAFSMGTRCLWMLVGVQSTVQDPDRIQAMLLIREVSEKLRRQRAWTTEVQLVVEAQG